MKKIGISPAFSWQKPIEEVILAYVKRMAREMEWVAREGQEEVREGASNYAKAYRGVQTFIENEIKLRK